MKQAWLHAALIGVYLSFASTSPVKSGFFDPPTSSTDALGPDFQKIPGGMSYGGCLVMVLSQTGGCMGNGTLNVEAVYINGTQVLPLSIGLGNLPKCQAPCVSTPVPAGQAFINASGYLVIAQP